jgi:nucleotide-binding universal stress UspA family protein
MQPVGSRYRVVVGLDYSDLGDAALIQALELVVDRPAGEVHAVNVTSAYGPLLRLDLPGDVKTMSAEEAQALLESHVTNKLLVEPGKPVARERVKCHVRVGPAPADEVVAFARELDADLIVVGTHGRRGVKRLLLGSVAEAIARRAACPVLVVRSKHVHSEPHG